MVLKAEALKETRAFYKVELRREDLTERERDKYSRALKLIEGFIKGLEDSRESREREKHKKVNKKLGASGKTKNPYLKKNNGGFDLIEIFPSYENRKKSEKKEGE